jgi:hypothetical protein
MDWRLGFLQNDTSAWSCKNVRENVPFVWATETWYEKCRLPLLNFEQPSIVINPEDL